MVKTLHPIETLAGILPHDDAKRVRLGRLKSREGVLKSTERPPRNAAAVSAAVREALAAPLDFPPLESTVVPGDRVAMAVDASVPQVAAVVRGVYDSLRSVGIESNSISVVTGSAVTTELCREVLGDREVQFITHDPADRENLCPLGVTRFGELLINRTLFDADVVLPIGTARLGEFGVFDGLYPQFHDEPTIERFRVPASTIGKRERDAFHEETDDAGSRIGPPLVARIVPGPEGSVGDIVIGEPEAVALRSAELCRARWSRQAERRASLVIASLGGGAESQTWQNVARSLATAERLVADDGAVAICSNITRAPGKSLSRLIGASDLERAGQRILSDRADDSWAAWELARALRRGPVYFLSQLDPEMIEEMGLAPVGEINEIVRLAGRHESFVFVSDSQNVVATVRGE